MIIETAQHYELIEDDPEYGMHAGDVLACVPHDDDKLNVCFRVIDGYDPACFVYRTQVRKVPGETPVRSRAADPWGFVRASS